MEVNLPLPRDWESFEDLATAVFARRFEAPTLKRYGRPGQAQYGVDSVGFTPTGLIGLQCKHHSEGKITRKEIDQTVTKAETFSPALQRLYIATSASKDTKIHSYVLEVSKKRSDAGTFPVDIAFWDELHLWLKDYPDLLRLYYRDVIGTLDHPCVTLPGAKACVRKTLSFCVPTTANEAQLSSLTYARYRGAVLVPESEAPASALPPFPALEDPSTAPKTLQSALLDATQARDWPKPYPLAVGLSTFTDVKPRDYVDLSLDWSDLFCSTGSPETNFKEATAAAKDFRAIIDHSSFSRRLTLHLAARLSACFLIGRQLSEVSGLSLDLVSRDMTATTVNNLPFVPSTIREGLPRYFRNDSRDAAISFCVQRDVSEKVRNHIGSLAPDVGLLRQYVVSSTVQHAAHALSIAKDLALRIKDTVDGGEVQRLHLFLLCPAFLATLIGHFLNATCQIALYFCDDAREFRLAGWC